MGSVAQCAEGQESSDDVLLRLEVGSLLQESRHHSPRLGGSSNSNDSIGGTSGEGEKRAQDWSKKKRMLFDEEDEEGEAQVRASLRRSGHRSAHRPATRMLAQGAVSSDTHTCKGCTRNVLVRRLTRKSA